MESARVGRETVVYSRSVSELLATLIMPRTELSRHKLSYPKIVLGQKLAATFCPRKILSAVLCPTLLFFVL